MKRAAKPLIITLVLVLLLFGIGSRVNKALHKSLPARTVVARRGDLVVKVSETGTIQPVDRVNVESKAPGHLLSISITEGQQLLRGQLIAVVDRSQLDP